MSKKHKQMTTYTSADNIRPNVGVNGAIVRSTAQEATDDAVEQQQTDLETNKRIYIGANVDASIKPCDHAEPKYLDHQLADEELVSSYSASDNYYEDDDDDDSESECHFLIGHDGAAAETRNKLLESIKQITSHVDISSSLTNATTTTTTATTSSSPRFKRNHSDISYTQANNGSRTSYRPAPSSNVLSRLFDSLKSSSTKHITKIISSTPASQTTDFHPTNDFVYSSSARGGGVSSGRKSISRNGRLSPTTNGRQQERSHSTNLCLLFFIFCGLIFASVMFLIKLLSLIPGSEQHSGGGVYNINNGSSSFKNTNFQYESMTDSSRWLVNTPKCHIPMLDPWHKSIQSEVKLKPQLDCPALIEKEFKQYADAKKYQNKFSSETISFVRSNKLYFSQRAVDDGALRDETCCYRPIDRSLDNDDDLEEANFCATIQEQGFDIASVANISSLIRIECPKFNYTNVHVFIRHELDEELALQKVADQKLNQDDYYNILMVGVDTISHLNGVRQFNKTRQFLFDQFKSIEFLGYNKVGENTFPNLIPLLTGLKPEQLIQLQCWLATTYTVDSDRGDDYLDNCRYLWNFYQQIGYVTYFSEDWPQASTFNYLKPGFKHEPTNHYGRPFTLARKSLLFPQFDSIGCASCQLDTPIVKIDLDNLKSFVEAHSGRPHFAFHWINCPQHDDLNGGSMVDNIMKSFFEEIHNITQLDRTFVIFFSDHGYRWNPFVSTQIGHYESSLPMFTMAPPARFIQRHPDLYKRLLDHQSALLTPFDMFKTLLAIRDLGAKHNIPKQSTRIRRSEQSNNGSAQINVTSTTTSTSTTAYPTSQTTIKQVENLDGSTFGQKFTTLSLLDEHSADDLDRSCIDAGIPDNYCVCHQFKSVNVNSSDVIGAAYYLTYGHFDSRLRNHTHICHQLELDQINRAEMFDFGNTPSTKDKTTAVHRRHRRQAKTVKPQITPVAKTTVEPFSTSLQHTTTARPRPIVIPDTSVQPTTENEKQYLPNREYNIMLTTKPGGGLFQEVVRFYGDDISKCKAEVERARRVVEDKWATYEDKHKTVMVMNQICEFSVHSESLSRLNLYKDQSKCVKSNIELKKICYCK